MKWHIWRWPTTVGTGATSIVVPTGVDDLGPVAPNADGSVTVFGTNGGRVGFMVSSAEFAFKGHKDEVRAGEVSADGRWAVSGGIDGRVVLWDRDALPPHSAKLGLETRGIAGLAVSPDVRWIVSGNPKGELVWISADADRPVLRVGPALQPIGEARGRIRGVTGLHRGPLFERVEASLFGEDIDGANDGRPRTLPCPGDQQVDGVRWARHHGLDRSIATVPDPAAQSQPPGPLRHGPPVADTLDPPADLKPQDGHDHGHTH